MKYHVITPFSRPANLPLLADMLEKQGVADWTLLLREDEALDILTPTGALPIRVVRLAVPTGSHFGLLLVNRFVMTNRFVPEDRYVFLMDDDFYQPGFFAGLDRHAAPVIICSMLRGHEEPAGSKHPCWTLVAAPRNMHYGHVGLEQGVLSGEVLNQIGAGMDDMTANNEDILIEAARRFPTAYDADLFVFFNYLEPGRWK